MKAEKIQVVYVDFDAGSAVGIVRLPGAKICARFIRLNLDQLREAGRRKAQKKLFGFYKK